MKSYSRFDLESLATRIESKIFNLESAQSECSKLGNYDRQNEIELSRQILEFVKYLVDQERCSERIKY